MELPEGRLFEFNWLISNVCIPERSDLRINEVDGGTLMHFQKSDPGSGSTELRIPADSFMLSPSSDPLIKFLSMWVITHNKFKSRICAIFTRADKMNYLLLIYFAYVSDCYLSHPPNVLTFSS